jgi:hypothetical protein
MGRDDIKQIAAEVGGLGEDANDLFVRYHETLVEYCARLAEGYIPTGMTHHIGLQDAQLIGKAIGAELRRTLSGVVQGETQS